MKCQILFSGKNKKNINLPSAENAQRVVKANMYFAPCCEFRYDACNSNTAETSCIINDNVAFCYYHY